MQFLSMHGFFLEIETEFNPKICEIIKMDKSDMDQVCSVLIDLIV